MHGTSISTLYHVLYMGQYYYETSLVPRLSPRAWVRGYYETHCISAILYIYNYCFVIEESISHAYFCHYYSILYEEKV